MQLSPMTKYHISVDYRKNDKTLITHRLRTDLERSVGVITAIQLVWLFKNPGTALMETKPIQVYTHENRV